MSALLVKDAPDGLHQWLKSEAKFNRRSIGQQILVCLEWCMRTYGAAQPRAPFASIACSESEMHDTTKCGHVRGRELAARLAAIGPMEGDAATEMREAVQALRKRGVREFDYACFA